MSAPAPFTAPIVSRPLTLADLDHLTSLGHGSTGSHDGIEALIDAGVHLGLERRGKRRIVSAQTAAAMSPRQRRRLRTLGTHEHSLVDNGNNFLEMTSDPVTLVLGPTTWLVTTPGAAPVKVASVGVGGSGLTQREKRRRLVLVQQSMLTDPDRRLEGLGGIFSPVVRNGSAHQFQVFVPFESLWDAIARGKDRQHEDLDSPSYRHMLTRDFVDLMKSVIVGRAPAEDVYRYPERGDAKEADDVEDFAMLRAQSRHYRLPEGEDGSPYYETDWTKAERIANNDIERVVATVVRDDRGDVVVSEFVGPRAGVVTTVTDEVLTADDLGASTCPTCGQGVPTSQP